ncbi:MAG: galactokinase [Treponema sp.]|jgi:galactokinase|nr:galactokinase [Treponema sp.]
MINREILKTDQAQKLFNELYGNSTVVSRYDALIAQVQRYGTDIRLFSAPGRTELGGNHTDHNGGKVLAASVHIDNGAAVVRTTEPTVRFFSTGYPDVTVDICDRAPRPSEKGTTEALIRGIAAGFSERGRAIGGWVACADSRVPGGSGLSSSAAVEVLIGRIFDNLYDTGSMSAVELAQIGQKAENDYFAKPSGLMDQIACAVGGIVAIDFKNPLYPLVESIAFDMPPELTLCVLDTHTNHADLTDYYASIPLEMHNVARFFAQESLREAEHDFCITAELRKSVGDRAVLRALHFFNENKRVDSMKEAIKQHSIDKFLDLVNESGDSSWELLQNCAVQNDGRDQGICLALGLTKKFLQKTGACRVHGGGFAGTIQCYIPTERFCAYKDSMEQLFGTGSVTKLILRKTGVCEIVF